jgi:2'-5' RNA ligase
MRGFSSLIPDRDIYQSPSGEHGREDSPHVTVKFGLHTDNQEEVWSLFRGRDTVEVTLGQITSFVNQDYVVLKIDIESKGLRELNRVISEELRCTDKFPEYKPHATLAYLKHRPNDPDYWKKYCCGMFAGERTYIDKFLFSTPSGKKSWHKAPVSLAAKVASSFIGERVWV